MKKLKILLVFFSISLFFIPRVFADSTLYNNEFKYDEEVVTIVNQYSNEISLIKDYIVDNGIGSYNLNSGNYLISYEVAGFSNNNIGVGLCAITDGAKFQSWWASNQYGTSNNAGLPSLTCYSQNFTINNGVVSTTSSAQLGSGSPATRGCMTCNPNEENCTCYAYLNYFDTSDLIDSQYININSRSCNGISGTCRYVPVMFSNFDNEVKVVGENISTKMLFDNLNTASPEPSHTYTTEILDTGNIKVDFNFSNYIEGSNYGYEIYNYVSGEYYGITNPYGNYPNIIPFGNNFSITIPFDTALYVRLYKYSENDRELIDQDVIDLNNIVFENPQDPYFKIITQSQNNIRGIFENTKSGYSCYYSNSNNNIVGVVICDEEEVNETFNFNGYIDFYIENQNGNKIYSRKINVLGADSTPYIVYSVEKQDFYSIVKWEVKNKNLDTNMKFRYSTDNGLNYSQWETIGNEYPNINVYSNTTVIIEISNSDNTTIYDSKAINVIENLETVKTFNKSSSNLINIFNNMFNVNTNILPKVVTFWNNIKGTKAYLLIFIPFIGSLIGGIIYLIRRK